MFVVFAEEPSKTLPRVKREPTTIKGRPKTDWASRIAAAREFPPGTWVCIGEWQGVSGAQWAKQSLARDSVDLTGLEIKTKTQRMGPSKLYVRREK